MEASKTTSKRRNANRAVTHRVRLHARQFYRFRSLLSVSAMRRIIFAALIVLTITTVVSMLFTQQQFRLQRTMERGEHARFQRRLGGPIRELAEAERTFERTNSIIETAFYVQTALTLALLGLCYVYFVNDRAVRVRQERKLRVANERLFRLVEADGLTELKNRRAFEHKLHEEWDRSVRYGSPLSLLLLDVDFFKSYNDTFGHLAGDIALKTAADVLRKEARRNDFPARYGGEEFAVLLPHTTDGAAMVAAERIRVAFLSARWPERPVTVSIGVATRTADTTQPTDMILAADHALYFAKHSGRNRVVHFRDAMPFP